MTPDPRFGRAAGIRTVCCYGGAPKPPQAPAQGERFMSDACFGRKSSHSPIVIVDFLMGFSCKEKRIHGSYGQKWVQLGGPKVDPFFSMRFVGELHSRKKETNVRNLKMMVLEFGDFSVNYEDCLVSMFVLESVHTCNVQSPLLKGLIIGGCQKPCLFTR